MSYYMTGTNGFGQDLLTPATTHGLVTVERPGGTVYRGGGARAHRGHRHHGHHGYGGHPPLWQYTAGAGPAMHGFGAAPDAASVCSDWSAGASGDNAAGNRAASAIQAQLNNAGFGPIAVDGQFGSESIAAWNRFAAANPGVTTDWPDCAGIETLMSGAAKGGTSKASMALGLGLLALLAIGAAALLAKKKHGAAHHKGHSGTDRLVIEEHRG